MSITHHKHDLYPETILIREFTGEISVDDNIDSWKYIEENKMINYQTKGIITILSECDLMMNLSSFDRLIAFLKQQQFLKGIKLAVVCDNPKTIIYPILGENKHSILKIKPFSTLKAAVEWIMFDF